MECPFLDPEVLTAVQQQRQAVLQSESPARVGTRFGTTPQTRYVSSPAKPPFSPARRQVPSAQASIPRMLSRVPPSRSPRSEVGDVEVQSPGQDSTLFKPPSAENEKGDV